MDRPIAVIFGVGDGLSASVARALSRTHSLVLAARTGAGMDDVAAETGADAHRLDATDPDAVADLFAALPAPPRVAIYNPSARSKGPVAELDPATVRSDMEVTAFGAFLLGKHAAARMLERPEDEPCRGTILFTGASAGVKGFPESAPFAMGKFAQRGLAQSMARELHPKGIHVTWVNIDGAIAIPGRTPSTPDAMLDPDAIACEYLNLMGQHRSTWSDELTLRPWVERF